MNKKMIIYILGKMLGVEGAVLLIPALVSLIYGEKSGFSFLIVGQYSESSSLFSVERGQRVQEYTVKKVLSL